MSKRLAVRPRAEMGQSLVETALVLPIVVLMLVGLFDLGRAVYAYNTISNAAREGSRVAAVNQITSAGGCDRSRPITNPATPTWSPHACAASAAIGLGVTAADVTVTYSNPPRQPALGCTTQRSVGCLVDVRVQYAWSPITPIISALVPTIDMSYTSQATIERVFP